LRRWGAEKISHPIVLSEAVWFFGLGLFPVAVGMGQVDFFHKNYVGWVDCGWDRMLGLYSMGYIGLIKEKQSNFGLEEVFVVEQNSLVSLKKRLFWRLLQGWRFFLLGYV
jgi:hypothetical protein